MTRFHSLYARFSSFLLKIGRPFLFFLFALYYFCPISIGNGSEKTFERRIVAKKHSFPSLLIVLILFGGLGWGGYHGWIYYQDKEGAKKLDAILGKTSGTQSTLDHADVIEELRKTINESQLFGAYIIRLLAPTPETAAALQQNGTIQRRLLDYYLMPNRMPNLDDLVQSYLQSADPLFRDLALTILVNNNRLDRYTTQLEKLAKREPDFQNKIRIRFLLNRPQRNQKIDTLINAAKISDIDSMRKVLTSEPELINAFTISDSMNALQAAVAANQIESVNYLLDKRADINAYNGNSTPLMIAAEKGNAEMIKLLLRRGAEGRFQAFITALYWLNPNVLSLLYSPSFPMVSPRTQTPLINYALARSDANSDLMLGAVKFLVEKGYDLSQRAPDGTGPLHLAAANGNVELMRYLAGRGCDPAEADSYGNTPLLYAARAGKLDNVNYLIGRNKTLLKAVNLNGDTALHLAARTGNSTLVKLLLDHGLDPDAVNNQDLTPIKCSTDMDTRIILRKAMQ